MSKTIYTLTIKNAQTGAELVMEFATIKLAEIYRDYHFAFGDWVGCKDISVSGSYKYSDVSFEMLRESRKKQLEQTDWTQLSDISLSQEQRKLYRTYRQYLRDVPSLHNDESITTAKVYSYEEWLDGKR